MKEAQRVAKSSIAHRPWPVIELPPIAAVLSQEVIPVASKPTIAVLPQVTVQPQVAVEPEPQAAEEQPPLEVRVVQVDEQMKVNTAKTTWRIETASAERAGAPKRIEAALEFLCRQIRKAYDRDEPVKLLITTALNGECHTLKCFRAMGLTADFLTRHSISMMIKSERTDYRIDEMLFKLLMVGLPQNAGRTARAIINPALCQSIIPITTELGETNCEARATIVCIADNYDKC